MPTHEQFAAFLQSVHQDFGFVREPVRSGGSLKAATKAGFIEQFSPLRAKLQGCVDAMMSEAVLPGIQRIVETASSRRSLVLQLRHATEEVYFPPCAEFLDHLCAASDRRLSLIAFGSTAFDLIRQMQRSQEFEGDSQDTKKIDVVRSILEFGITNIAHKVWSLLEVVPHVYRERRRVIAPGAYDATSRTTYALIRLIADSHDHIFHAVMHFLVDGENGNHPDEWPPLKPDRFVLNGDEMTIDPELFEFIRMKLDLMFTEEGIERGTPWVGCGGSFLFRPVFDGCMGAARESLFRDPERIVALPCELEETVPTEDTSAASTGYNAD